MRALVALACACALPCAAQPSEPYLDDRVTALWVGPLGPLAIPVLGLAVGKPMGWFQLGGTSSLTQRVAVTADLAMVFGAVPAVLASIGPQFSFGRRALTGFFVLPKLIVEHDAIDAKVRAAGSGSVQLGVDLGWQFDTGRFYLAFVIGASVGYGWNWPSNFRGPFEGAIIRSQQSVAVGLNPNVLRLGVRF